MRNRSLMLAVLVLLVLPGVVLGAARREIAPWTERVRPHDGRSPIIIFYDDMESGQNGWTHVDNTVGAVPKFHLDTYYAYEGTYSWWCGELNAAFSGGDGYGNAWDQILRIPETDVTGATYPVLTFAHRHDSEPGYDYTYIQAESLGVFVDLGPGLDGSSGGWQDLGDYGYLLGDYDNPVNARIRFISDGAWSDADGLYDSDGGAFMVDNVRIFDFYSSTDYFFDDGESGGLCVPAVPGSAGDYWHIISRRCPAWSDPHSWWCGDDADTSLIPPNLNNSLISPPVSLAGVAVCTLRFLLHAEVPTVDNDWWKEEITTDGGGEWYTIGNWWGDFGQCSGWALAGINGHDLSPYLPGTFFKFRITFFTTSNGCGPGAAGGAGIMLDDTWLEDWTDTPVQSMTWGRLKAMYR
ncbi:MAG: hypothetical protein FJY74_01305 [Candidatus Eisenbacteria bacterium]|nr:hypothetical protein [Candidatus Eisenbacteria bacterium]